MSYNTLPANGAAPTGLSHHCTNHMPPATLGIDRATSIFWQVTNSDHTLDLYVPFVFHYNSGEPDYMPRDWRLAATGDLVTGALAQTFFEVPEYETPRVCDPTLEPCTE